MDPIEKQVMQEDIQSQTSGDPLETPSANPDNEAMRQKMIRRHTERQMAVSQKEKELDRRLAELDSMRAMMQQQQQGAPRGQTETPSPYGEWSPALQEAIQREPLIKELVTGIDRKYGRTQDTSEFSSLKQEIESLKSALSQQQQHSRLQQMQVQAAHLAQKYGKAIDPVTSEEAIKFAWNNNIDLDRALGVVNPDLVHNHIRQQALAEAREELNQKFAGRLNGFEKAIGSMPKESASPLKKDGTMESMEESAMQALGRDAYIAAMMPQPGG